MATMDAGNNTGTGERHRNPRQGTHQPAATNQTEAESDIRGIARISPRLGAAITVGSSSPAVIPAISPPALQPPTYPSTSTLAATSGVSDEAEDMTADRDVQERSVEDDDYHTISSGSDTEYGPCPWRFNSINPNYPISIHNSFVVLLRQEISQQTSDSSKTPSRKTLYLFANLFAHTDSAHPSTTTPSDHPFVGFPAQTSS
ncbi:hypothetical protein BYT27DRAFT_7264717 [Phlegmacium glaucopus]|nr:hypothetical protein BYT27DRAFT_7264717 [Phlegmacium glaucopus]